jgi:hypothetical protein
VPDIGDGISVEEWAWLEALPRRTLQNRVDYWEARHRLEDREPSRVRPYVYRHRHAGWFDTGSPRVV